MILWIDYENSQSKLKENKLYEEFLSLESTSKHTQKEDRGREQCVL